MSELKQLRNSVSSALKQKDWETGSKLLKQWTRQRPKDPMGWYYRAYFYMKLNKLEKAEKAIQISLKLKPGNNDSEKLLRLVREQAGEGTSDTNTPKVLWRPGRVIGGRYEVKDSKKGGMGEVYFAYDRELERMVAIKAPHLSLLENEAQKARFYREAEAWMGLGIHPNICSAFYVREIRNIPWLFIEYVGGGTLVDWMKNENRTVGDKLDIAIQIASGMKHTHTFFWRDDEGAKHQGVVHRDLKPANILISYDGAAKITDFGLVGRVTEAGSTQSKRVGIESYLDDEDKEIKLNDTLEKNIGTDVAWHTITLAGMALGTPPYMAPEQWDRAHTAGFPADVYAYGCLLYDIFCAQRPFQLDAKYRHAMPVVKLMQWEKMHLEDEPPDPREMVEGLDDRLAEYMLQCMAKSPEDRPKSFHEVRSTLIEIYESIAHKNYPRPEPRASRLLADSLNNQGVSYMTIGQVRRAESAWREALKTDPHHIEASFNTAMFESKYKGSGYEEVYRRMVEVGRTHANVRRHKQVMGQMCLYFGDYSRAVTYLEQADSGEGASPRELKHYGLGLCADIGPSNDPVKWRRAEEIFTRVMDLGYEDPAVITGRSLAMRRSGRPDEAETFYDWASRRFGDMPRSLNEAIHRYLTGQEIISTVLHHGWVNHLWFNPDGRMILSGGENKISAWEIQESAKILAETGTVEIGLNATGSFGVAPSLADIRTGTTLREMLLKEGLVKSMQFSSDGRLAVTGSASGEVRVWTLENGECIQTFTGHKGEVNAVAFGPESQTLLSGSSDADLKLWDLQSGRCFETFTGHDGGIVYVNFTPDGVHIVSAAEDGAVRIWDSYSGDSVSVLEGHTDKILGAAMSPNGRFLATGSNDRTIRLWDLDDRICRRVWDRIDYKAVCLTFTPDGGKILTGGDDRALRVWDVKSGRMEKKYKIEHRVEAVAISHDGRLAALAHANVNPPNSKTICLLEFVSQDRYKVPYVVTQPVSAMVADERETEYLARLEDAKNYLEKEDVNGAMESLAKARKIPGYERDVEALDLWSDLAARYPHASLRTGWELETFRGHRGPVRSLALGRKGQLMVTGGDDGEIRVWDVRGGICLRILSGHNGSVTGVGLYARDNMIISSGADGSVRFWDMNSGMCNRVHVEHDGEVNALAVSPDGKYAVTGGMDSTLRLWDLSSRICIRAWEAHKGPITTVAFNPDGLNVISGGRDKTIRIWELVDFSCSRLLRTNIRQVNGIMVSPCGNWLLAACDDTMIRKYSVHAEEIPEMYGGHSDEVNCVAILPDCDYAISGSLDQSVRLWNLQAGRYISSFESHSAGVNAIAVSPDRRFVVSAGEDQVARLWYLDWEPDVRKDSDWSENVRPYLETFLTLHTPYSRAGLAHIGKPKWKPDDFDTLMQDLSWKGFGWLTPKGVRQELKKMAKQRKTPFKELVKEFLGDIADEIRRILSPLSFLLLPLKIIYKLLPAGLMTYILLTNDFLGMPTVVGILIILFLLVITFAKKK